MGAIRHGGGKHDRGKANDDKPIDLGGQPARGAQGRPDRRQRGVPCRVRCEHDQLVPERGGLGTAAAASGPPASPSDAPSAAPVSYAGVTLNNSTGGYSIPAFQIGLDAWKAETGGNATFNNIPFDEKPVKYASFIATQDSSWDLHYTYDNFMQKFGTRLLLPLEGNYTGDLSDFIQTALPGFTTQTDQVLRGLPIHFSSWLWTWNPALFTAIGEDGDNPPDTYEALFALTPKFVEKKIIPCAQPWLGAGGTFAQLYWTHIYNSTGHPMFSDDRTQVMFDGPEGLSAFQTIEAGLKSGFWDPAYLNITNEHEAFVEFAKGNMATVMHSESVIRPDREGADGRRQARTPASSRASSPGRPARPRAPTAPASTSGPSSPKHPGATSTGCSPLTSRWRSACTSRSSTRRPATRSSRTPRSSRPAVPHPGAHGAGQGRHQPVVDAVQLRTRLRRRGQQDDQGRVLRPAGPRRGRHGRQRPDHQVPQRLARHAAGTAGRRSETGTGRGRPPALCPCSGSLDRVRVHSPPTIPASLAPGNPTCSPTPIAAWPPARSRPPSTPRSCATAIEQVLAGAGAVGPRDPDRRGRRARGPPARARRRARRHELGPARGPARRRHRARAPLRPARPPGGRRSPSTTGAGPTGRPTSRSSRCSSGRTRSPGWPIPAAHGAEVLALGLAEALNAELRALAAAGCPIIQVDEGALTTIGDDEAEWASLCRDAATSHRRPRRPPPEPRHLPRRHRSGGPRGRPRRPVPELPGRRAGRSRCLAVRVRRPARGRGDRRGPRCGDRATATRPR